jgi:hypothetical protein
LIVLHSPVTMASIAARTFFEIRFGGPISVVGAGWSRAASARLAGVPGGVMFSMSATVGCWRPSATHYMTGLIGGGLSARSALAMPRHQGR